MPRERKQRRVKAAKLRILWKIMLWPVDWILNKAYSELADWKYNCSYVDGFAGKSQLFFKHNLTGWCKTAKTCTKSVQ